MSQLIPHAATPDAALDALGVKPVGLTSQEAEERAKIHGLNELPEPKTTSLARLFLRQFLNPLIYILLAAGALSLSLGELSDALFIFAVLLINAFIGTFQEHGAERSALALRKLSRTEATVLRDGTTIRMESVQIVPGDIIRLESGDKVPADVRLLSSTNLNIDESLLTGESLASLKNHAVTHPIEATIGDRSNMAFAGTMVTTGRGSGVVTATSLATELGRIASSVVDAVETKTPLIQRMEVFTRRIALILIVVTVMIGAILLFRGHPWTEVLFLTIAFAVAAIPEGLPVALTVALAVASRRMAARGVIVRKLASVETLGSCTIIGTDKTGTLTVNELTVQVVALPFTTALKIEDLPNVPQPTHQGLLQIAKAAALCNEGTLRSTDEGFKGQGDAVDVALLVFAHKLGIERAALEQSMRRIGEIPYESANGFAASLFEIRPSAHVLAVKGAFERVLGMCSQMQGQDGSAVPLATREIEAQAHALAEQGYRVLAFAMSETAAKSATVAAGTAPHVHRSMAPSDLTGMTFLGLVGMIDPLRADAKGAINCCREAGINVAMITGDHPITAFAIARELGLADEPGQIVTGRQLAQAKSEEAIDAIVGGGRVFARVEPAQKLAIVHSLIRLKNFIAVTGDGANDAPALRAAHVGVAMGRSGTDVARETSDLIITDDRFASIVAGIEQGRIAYSNVRKIIYLLITTGAAEIALFFLCIIAGLPMPLSAAQLLWLNIVTNGIQHIGLAVEPGEGDELQHPPRPPNEPIFNRVMIERVALGAVLFGSLAFWLYDRALTAGAPPVEARNLTLLLMVLFENVLIATARSETKHPLHQSPLRNPLLFLGAMGALLIHVWAMHSTWMGRILGTHAASRESWLWAIALAALAFIIMEAHKHLRRLWARGH